jgi:hypothetical protein
VTLAPDGSRSENEVTKPSASAGSAGSQPGKTIIKAVAKSADMLKRLCIGLVLAIISAQTSIAVGAQNTTSAPTVTAVRAQLYFEETGTFSRDILVPPAFVLWNTIIGEGDAGRASHSTLVTAEVSGNHVAVGAVRVTITASGSNGRTLARHETTVDLYDNKVRFYAPLFLVNTGCDKITITARLSGRGVSTTPAVRMIPFHCGE